MERLKKVYPLGRKPLEVNNKVTRATLQGL